MRETQSVFSRKTRTLFLLPFTKTAKYVFMFVKNCVKVRVQNSTWVPPLTEFMLLKDTVNIVKHQE